MHYKRSLWFLFILISGIAGKAIAAEAFDIRYQQNTAVADTRVILTDSTLTIPADVSEQIPQINTLITQQKFSGKTGQLLEIPVSATQIPYQRIVLLGTGEQNTLNVKAANQLGSTLTAFLQHSPAEKITLETQNIASSLGNAELATQIAHGIQLRSYQFRKYHSNQAAVTTRQISIIVDDSTLAQARHQQLTAVTAGVFLARDLTNEPANVMTPENFARQAQELKKLGVKVEAFADKELKKHGLGAIIAVGQGSINAPRLVIAHWQGSKNAPVAFVGKGITFDSGGYNLKTSAESIHRMTSDMAGGAAVLGAIKALALQKAPINAVGVIALAENRISDRAYLPGDIITTGAGLTVEILNTDAEGRLVLADALWWVNKQYNPAAIIDLATLTGAKVTAVGTYYAGAFSEHDQLTEQLRQAGETVDEKIWRLPLSKEFAPEVKSRVADLRNTGRSTGASSAAYFLQRFVGETPWVHLDIAGNALTNSTTGVTPEGATGFGVRLLTEWAATQQ